MTDTVNIEALASELRQAEALLIEKFGTGDVPRDKLISFASEQLMNKNQRFHALIFLAILLYPS